MVNGTRDREYSTVSAADDPIQILPTLTSWLYSRWMPSVGDSHGIMHDDGRLRQELSMKEWKALTLTKNRRKKAFSSLRQSFFQMSVEMRSTRRMLEMLLGWKLKAGLQDMSLNKDNVLLGCDLH
jgi:hypothetical protein